MVFDMIANAPGVLNSSLQWGRLQALTSAGGDPNPTLALNPTAFDFKPPKRHAVEHRRPAQAVETSHPRPRVRRFDVDRPAAAGADQRLAVRGDVRGRRTRIRRASPSDDAGVDSAAERLAASLPGLRQHPHVGLQRLLELSRAADVVTRRFDSGFMFSCFYVWSKALGINSNDFAAGVPNLSEEETRRLDYSLLDYDRPHNFVINFIYQTPRSRQRQGARPAGERVADFRRLPLDEREAVRRRLPDSGHRRPEPDRHRRQPERAHRPDLRSGPRLVAAIRTTSSTRRASHRRSRAATATNRRGSSCARRRSTTSTCRSRRSSRSPKHRQVRGAARHVQRPEPYAVHRRQLEVNFTSLTDRTITNLPYDASGALVRPNGFGTINGVAPPRTLQLVTRVTF